MQDVVKTLFHPFATGLIDWPGADQRAIVVNGPPDFRLPANFAARPLFVQDFRPDYLALEKAGHRVVPALEGEGYDMAFLICGRHRGQNEAWLQGLAARTRPAGRIVVAGGKKEGVASLAKRVAAIRELDGRVAKHHGIAFWFEPPAGSEGQLRFTPPARAAKQVGAFETAPGMFSHDRVDAGSRLLGEYLPTDLSGAVADFGAGWGYLSVTLASRAPGVTRIDLYEASYAAANAARRNMAKLAPAVSSDTNWHCLLSEPVTASYDAIVMNPPFHQGRAAEPSIGEGMIRAAAKALRPRGRLFMVANQPLPYEKTIAACFAGQRELVREGGFKVVEAWR